MSLVAAIAYEVYIPAVLTYNPNRRVLGTFFKEPTEGQLKQLTVDACSSVEVKVKEVSLVRHLDGKWYKVLRTPVAVKSSVGAEDVRK